MPGPLANRFVSVRQGAYLPHWTARDAVYHSVSRLVDSLPSNVVERYRREHEAMLAEIGDTSVPAISGRLEALFSDRIERYLDAGHGPCWLRQPSVAQIVADALRYFDGTRYFLHAWSIMPNHIHVVFQPCCGHELSSIVHSWKSFSAKEANRVMGRTGSFWQKESYDYIARDAADLERTIRYVCENPATAGLKNWEWVWPK